VHVSRDAPSHITGAVAGFQGILLPVEPELAEAPAVSMRN
jgi:hypothetical protein